MKHPDQHANLHQNGFTLFEVLGAVALLAIVYTMLSTAAIRGLRNEGDSRRILEASMKADWHLAALELQIDQGLIPELGVTESEEDGYRIRVEVTTFDLPVLAAGPVSLLAAETSESVSAQPQSQPLFGGASPLREIQLVVSWGEPENERSVTRASYGLDATALQPAPGASGNPSTAPPGGGAQTL